MSATAFKSIAAPKKPGERDESETTKGLRASDKGFLNTAVIQSEITYTDGEAGSKAHLASVSSPLTQAIPVLHYRVGHLAHAHSVCMNSCNRPEDTPLSNWPSNLITSRLLISLFMVSCPPRSNITALGLKSPVTELYMPTPRVSSVRAGLCAY